VFELEREGTDYYVVSFHVLVEGVDCFEQLDQKDSLALLYCRYLLLGIPQMSEKMATVLLV
jgi:hypothetical protein